MINLFICPLKSFYDNPGTYDYPRHRNDCCQYYRRWLPHACIKITKANVDLMNTLRMLWEQHDAWTRAVITSIAQDLPDEDLVTKRLLRNPSDFADALRPYYGDRIASKFSDLLKSHLVIAAQLVKASKAGNTQAAAKAERDWYANADEIAVFLGNINPYWSEESWKAMMHRHLELIKAEAVYILTKNYEEGIAVYDEIEKQTLEMADMMTEGTIRQFENRLM